MSTLIIFWIFAIVTVVLTIKYKKPILLMLPFFAMGAYLVIQIALVPLPFMETVRFIFSLR
ncbi:hypothetical protein CR194_06870 [Salipaludibacillus keqinensis]|uniref:Uncharacterized protein n=1 Tax=Salipaludibacillus keqinensis TaxID=2045207 RepID=A0A323TKU3_9BACI|nr:hypothetical protein [Salipaludibacillus keqinensis]PYZ95230.1 hypothetical protein CR194_06870 [Salipaludibacillus keqinensis]